MSEPNKNIQPGTTPPNSIPSHGSRAELEPNPLAITGFVFAILGFFTCMLTAPIGFICGALGMRKRNNFGLATTGMIIGLLQSLVLFTMVIMLIVFGGLTGMTAWMVGSAVQEAHDQAVINRQIAQTESILNDVAKQCENAVYTNQQLLSETQGAAQIAQTKDVWDTVLKYSVNEGRQPTFTISSAGPDVTWGTKDDLKVVVNSPIPTDIPTAIALLGSRDTRRIEGGLKFVANAEPDDQYRRQVVNAVVPLFRVGSHTVSAQQVLKRWINADTVSRIDMKDGQTARAILPVLIEQGSQEQAISNLNHPDANVRILVKNAVAKWKTPEEPLIAQSIKDLADPQRQGHAFMRLQSANLSAEQEVEIGSAAVSLLSNTRDQKVLEQLLVWLQSSGGIEENEIVIAGAFHRTQSEAAKKILLANPSAKVLRWFANELAKPGDMRATKNFLVAAGPVAESFLWPHLSNQRNTYVLENLIEVLGLIGTSESVAHLEPLANRNAKAGEAIRAIETANRTPVEAPAG